MHSKLKPQPVVYHGTDAFFDHFDQSNCLGAHFGTRQAAVDRLRSTGRDQIELIPYEDCQGRWWAIENTTNNTTNLPPEHGPFEDEDAAATFCECADKTREPLGFEIDVSRPLIVEDLGTWEFQGVARFLRLNHPDIDDSAWQSAWNQSNEAGWTALKDSLRAAGYDCIAYKNETEDPGSWSWIVWDNTKIHRDWKGRMAMDPDCLSEHDYGPVSSSPGSGF